MRWTAEQARLVLMGHAAVGGLGATDLMNVVFLYPGERCGGGGGSSGGDSPNMPGRSPSEIAPDDSRAETSKPPTRNAGFAEL
jgi:hypothetical protein